MDKVLVACPNHECKEYTFQRWIDAVNALTYHKDTLVVDNTEEPRFYRKWCNKVPMVHYPIGQPPNRRIALSMEYIRKVALEYDWWLNIESDVIVPWDTIEVMLGYAMGTGWATEDTDAVESTSQVDWLSAPYMSPCTHDWIRSAFGCTLFSRRLLEAISFEKAPNQISTDGWLRFTIVKPMHKFNLCDLHVGVLEIEHLHDLKVEVNVW